MREGRVCREDISSGIREDCHLELFGVESAHEDTKLSLGAMSFGRKRLWSRGQDVVSRANYGRSNRFPPRFDDDRHRRDRNSGGSESG